MQELKLKTNMGRINYLVCRLSIAMLCGFISYLLVAIFPALAAPELADFYRTLGMYFLYAAVAQLAGLLFLMFGSKRLLNITNLVLSLMCFIPIIIYFMKIAPNGLS